METLNLEERKLLLEEAMEDIDEALGKIRRATKGTPAESRAEAYPINNMKAWLGQGYQPGNIPDLIESLEGDSR